MGRETSLNDTDIDTIIQKLVELGYRGFKNGMFQSILKNSKSPITVLNALGFPNKVGAGNLELMGKLSLDQMAELKIIEAMRNTMVDDGDSGDDAPEDVALSANAQKILARKEDLVFAYNIVFNDAKSRPIIVFDKGTRTVLKDWNPQTIAKILGYNLKSIETQNKNFSSITFDGGTTDLYVKKVINGIEVTCLNAHRAPEWRTDEKYRRQGKFDGIIKIIFENLFTDKSEYDQILDWLHYAVTSRCETALICTGSKGIGKGIFFSEIMRGLLGHEYVKDGAAKTLSGEAGFNSEFDFARMIVFDEVKVDTTEKENNLKKWLNARFPIEKKGMDVQQLDNMASVVLLSNNIQDFRISPDNRRYSIPEVGTVDLKNKLDHNVLEKFVQDISKLTPDGMELLADFGWFLLNRKPRGTPFSPIMNHYFYHICDLGVPMWLEALRQFVEGLPDLPEGEKYPTTLWSDFRKDYEEIGHIPSKTSTILKMVSEYKIMGKYPICDFTHKFNKKGNRALAIQPIEESKRQLKVVRQIREKRGYLTKCVEPDEKEGLNADTIEALVSGRDIVDITKSAVEQKFESAETTELNEHTQNSEIETEEGDIL